MAQQHKVFYENQKERIDLEDGEWVDIKHKLTIGDQDALGDKLMNIELDTKGTREERRRLRQSGNFPGKVAFKPSTAAILEIAILDWSFTYEDGSKVPITSEMIRKMDPVLANRLEDEIDQRNPLAPEPLSNTPTASTVD